MASDTHPEFRDQGFAHLKLGRAARRVDPKTLRLETYLDLGALPPVPPAIDYTPGISFPMFGNDRLGDCTVAAAGHMIQVWKHLTGKTGIPSEATIEKTYFATGDGTDDGRNELDVLNYWRHHGVGRDKITAYVAVNPTNVRLMQAAIYLFGGVYAGISLPLTAQAQHSWDLVGDGHTGRSAPGSWGGHAVPFHGYTPDGFRCVTWGATLDLTVRFNHAYTEEAYAILSPDWLKDGHTPAGFDKAALLADLALLADGNPR